MTTFRKISIMFACAVLVGVVTYIATTSRPPKYAASLAITVDRAAAQSTVEYQYDGYYAIQAADLFSQTLLSWFLTPSTLLSFYEEAGLDPQVTSLTEIVGRFRARKFSAQNIVVQFSDADKQTAERLAKAINTVVERQGEELNETTSGDALFDIRPQPPVIVETRPSAATYAVLAFVATVFLAFVVFSAFRSSGAEHANRH